MATSKAPWYLIALVFTASCLSLIFRSMSYDECFSAITYFRASCWEIISGHYFPNNHVTYSLLAHASRALLGESDLSLRLPSVLAALAALGAVAWLGRRFLPPDHVAMMVFLTMLAPGFRVYATEARGYMLSLAFFLWSFCMLEHALESRKIGSWSAFAALFAVCGWTHLFSLHLVVVLVLWTAVRRPFDWPNWLRFVLALSVSVVMLAILISPKLSLAHLIYTRITTGRFPDGYGFSINQPFPRDLHYLGLLSTFYLAGDVVPSGMYLALAALGLGVCWRSHRPVFWLFVVFSAPLLLCAAANLLYPPRYYMYLGAALAALVACGLLQWQRLPLPTAMTIMWALQAPWNWTAAHQVAYAEEPYVDIKGAVAQMHRGDTILNCTDVEVGNDWQINLQYYLGAAYEADGLQQMARRSGAVAYWYLAPQAYNSVRTVPRSYLYLQDMTFARSLAEDGCYLHYGTTTLDPSRQRELAARYRGFVLFKNGYYDQTLGDGNMAANYYRQFEAIGIRAEMAKNNLALLVVHQDPQQSLRLLREALLAQPHYSVAMYNYGALLALLPSYADLSRACLRDLMAGFPDFSQRAAVEACLQGRGCSLPFVFSDIEHDNASYYMPAH